MHTLLTRVGLADFGTTRCDIPRGQLPTLLRVLCAGQPSLLPLFINRLVLLVCNLQPRCAARTASHQQELPAAAQHAGLRECV
jgi:hypothetical protein